jgi:hypothetical protein
MQVLDVRNMNLDEAVAGAASNGRRRRPRGCSAATAGRCLDLRVGGAGYAPERAMSDPATERKVDPVGQLTQMVRNPVFASIPKRVVHTATVGHEQLYDVMNRRPSTACTDRIRPVRAIGQVGEVCKPLLV